MSDLLLKKYDVPGPRYTSYPTVPYWTTHPSQAEWKDHILQSLRRAKENDEGASVYVHIPYCRSLCHYCGCHTVITRDGSVSDPYVETLLAEWKLYTDLCGTFRVDELHLGGGTPTFLPPEQLERLINGMKASGVFGPTAALSIEADPRTTTVAHIEMLAKLGFTRLSLGVQDFDPAVQHAVHRVQTEDEVRLMTETARRCGFVSVNFDLIYGLPKQSPESIRRTMALVKQLRPDRIAFYGYAHVPWMKTVQRRFSDAEVPAGPEKRQLYETGLSELAEAGYLEIGMDHFALPHDALRKAYVGKYLHRNFMGYTERRTTPMLGLGVSSIGDTWTAFAQNEKSVPEWTARVTRGEFPIFRGHVLDAEDQVLRSHIVNVMTRFETDWSEDLPATPFLSSVPERLSELVSDGLINLDASRLTVTERGHAFVRNVCMALDARLVRHAPDRPLFSRTI